MDKNLFPNTTGYSINKLLSLLGKYSGAHVPSNNKNHNHYPLNTPGKSGPYSFINGDSTHYVNIITLDGMRQFYEGPEFQNNILPELYDFTSFKIT
jgi:hypothetical protein